MIPQFKALIDGLKKAGIEVEFDAWTHSFGHPTYDAVAFFTVSNGRNRITLIACLLYTGDAYDLFAGGFPSPVIHDDVAGIIELLNNPTTV